MYGRVTKSQRLREIRKANDKEGRLERAALIRIQARRLEESSRSGPPNSTPRLRELKGASSPPAAVLVTGAAAFL